ncbi:Imm52 family immunity protein [Streptomyces sp. MMS24-I31]|uniref:Imm52 family immunity protein n=1 Tax=Streptomyces sp. MMS24-I31 TaxID=3351563 RepID=UPI003896A421
MRRLVRGFWGPREEPAEELAGRWNGTLEQLTRLLPEAGLPGMWRVVRASGPPSLVPADGASLLDALSVARAADDWSEGTGIALRLVAAGAPGWEVEVSGLAGGRSEFLLQSLVIVIRTPAAAELPGSELLAAVAECWEPDFGDVTDDDVLDALEDEAGYGVGEPSVGWFGYLSPARGSLLPEDLAAPCKEMRGGGVLLDIAPQGDTDTVVQTYVRLREAGALQPLPRPMDRATL